MLKVLKLITKKFIPSKKMGKFGKLYCLATMLYFIFMNVFAQTKEKLALNSSSPKSSQIDDFFSTLRLEVMNKMSPAIFGVFGISLLLFLLWEKIQINFGSGSTLQNGNLFQNVFKKFIVIPLLVVFFPVLSNFVFDNITNMFSYTWSSASEMTNKENLKKANQSMTYENSKKMMSGIDTLTPKNSIVKNFVQANEEAKNLFQYHKSSEETDKNTTSTSSSVEEKADEKTTELKNATDDMGFMEKAIYNAFQSVFVFIVSLFAEVLIMSMYFMGQFGFTITCIVAWFFVAISIFPAFRGVIKTWFSTVVNYAMFYPVYSVFVYVVVSLIQKITGLAVTATAGAVAGGGASGAVMGASVATQSVMGAGAVSLSLLLLAIVMLLYGIKLTTQILGIFTSITDSGMGNALFAGSSAAVKVGTKGLLKLPK